MNLLRPDFVSPLFSVLIISLCSAYPSLALGESLQAYPDHATLTVIKSDSYRQATVGIDLIGLNSSTVNISVSSFIADDSKSAFIWRDEFTISPEILSVSP